MTLAPAKDWIMGMRIHMPMPTIMETHITTTVITVIAMITTTRLHPLIRRKTSWTGRDSVGVADTLGSAYQMCIKKAKD
jgi:hypothetical protein